MGHKWIYAFEEGRASMRSLLGGKGCNLAEMTYIGLPVPPGFTVTTEACIDYTRNGRFPAGLEEEILQHMAVLEKKLGKGFGDQSDPLLVSVRSGAAVSMPGMMDTVLNLGLNDQSVEGLAQATNNRRFALDAYRRFIQMFGDVVMGIAHSRFDQLLERQKQRQGVEFDMELSEGSLARVIEEYKGLIHEAVGRSFPQDPREQLMLAIRAVFESWDNERARVYRRLNKIPDDLGTGVNVQAMVFGNMGNDCGTGVVFTRSPSTGEPELYGEYLINAQGEDVVAGIRTPRPISEMESELPEAYRQLRDVANLLEQHFGDMQDLEFTVERSKLYMLQARTGKRTARAAVRIAYDLVQAGLLTKDEALLRVEPDQVERLLHRTIDAQAADRAVAKGLPASPGAASGQVVFEADEAERLGKDGAKVILVRSETTPDDIHGIIEAEGILTSRGGMTSHAAVVARGMGKPCVAGCEALRVDPVAEEILVNGQVIRQGDLISIDGSTGHVYIGEVPLVDPELTDEFQAILQWADEAKRLGVRANADTPEDARNARGFGAQGIGLCRTEHMFMAPERLPVVQQMIMAETVEERRQALDRLLPMQQKDFEGILEAMAGLPVTIRLLDPPLHEFLPDIEDLIEAVTRREAQANGEDPELVRQRELLRRARLLAEKNPMLGFRGTRIGIVYPEIYEMQTRAIFQATAALLGRGIDAQPEVMIPLVSHFEELARMKKLVVATGEKVAAETGTTFPVVVGTMIEVPRAALTAGEIAREAEFFSFGTNDLTQTTFGFSRDDAEGKFLHHYVDEKILADNPFAVLDTQGVGRLVELATREGRESRPDLKVGICGEHGGNPPSVEFCHQAGLNYVSCSPFRVPVARLAAAQAWIKEQKAVQKS